MEINLFQMAMVGAGTSLAEMAGLEISGRRRKVFLQHSHRVGGQPATKRLATGGGTSKGAIIACCRDDTHHSLQLALEVDFPMGRSSWDSLIAMKFLLLEGVP